MRKVILLGGKDLSSSDFMNADYFCFLSSTSTFQTRDSGEIDLDISVISLAKDRRQK